MTGQQVRRAGIAVLGTISLLAAAPSLTNAEILSSLSGWVYVDENFDGVRDVATEWVLPGIEVVLTNDTFPWLSVSTLTDDTGHYEFTDLVAGDYTITQPEIPVGYMTVNVGVGELFDAQTNQPIGAFAGIAVPYDQQNGIPAQVAGIELPAEPAVGRNYNFGQIWIGKFLYLTTGEDPGDPPGAVPPVPEPDSLVLLALGSLVFFGMRRLRRWRGIA
jgi:hypothetical protein